MPGFIFAALSNSSLMKACREGEVYIGNGHQNRILYECVMYKCNYFDNAKNLIIFCLERNAINLMEQIRPLTHKLWNITFALLRRCVQLL